ncbi:MAG: chemotaxis protein CheC [Dehalococcoidia bacterium]|nr:chemotaxis protein CheC [Dehalococcoidia bacterium]
MSSSTQLSERDLSHLQAVVSLGFDNAASGLSGMVDKTIAVKTPGLRLVKIEEAPTVLQTQEEEVYAAYVGITGDVGGHILLIFSLPAAEEMVTMLMGPREVGSAMDEVELSALGEVANITGSFFLRALSDKTSLDIRVSPPCLVLDMAAAVMDGPLVSLAMTTEEVLIIDTWFADEEHQIGGLFMVLPDSNSLKKIVERLS